MNAIPFVNIEAGDGFWLSDLKPQGYFANSNFERRGTDGDFSVQILNEEGRAIAIYNWKHTCNKGTWANDAHWNDPSSHEVVPHQVGSDYFFKQGTGLWTFAPAKSTADATASYTVNSAGAVETNDVIWTLASVSGAVAVANPYPVAIKISSLKPTGYLNNANFERRGTDGDFSVQILNQEGRAIAIYNWKHTCNKGTWAADAHWNDPSAHEVVPGGDNDLTIQPGQGLWIFAPAHSGDTGTDYTIEVKCPAF